MKALVRGFGVALATLMFLGSNGCSPDNESEALQIHKTAEPLKDAPKGDNPAPKQASSYEEYAKQQPGGYSGQGYPGYKAPAASKKSEK